MKAVIVGAGVGGLSAALHLLRVGWEVEVLEQARAIREVGAGLQISPNGVKTLAALGLAEKVAAAAFEPEVLEMRLGASGRRIFSLPQRGAMRRRFGAPYLQIHRADLIETLRDALAIRAPGALRPDSRVIDIRRAARQATAITTAGPAATGDVVIGADGIHSAVRAAILGSESPRFTGNVAWRAVVPRAAVAADLPDGACIWAGPGRHAVTYPIRRGELINFVGVVERGEPGGESWTEAGTRAELSADFDGWAAPLRAVIDAVETPFRWALYDRTPLPRWTDGRVALLGDACHPMLPSLAQGACQAMEDAVVLANRLANVGAGDGAVPNALEAYFRARHARTARVQSAAAANVRLFHKRSPLSQAAFYAPIWAAAQIAPAALSAKFAWVYSHEAA